jgi:hypothetical protein
MAVARHAASASSLEIDFIIRIPSFLLTHGAKQLSEWDAWL